VRARTLLQQFRRTIQALAEQGIEWRSAVRRRAWPATAAPCAAAAHRRRRFLSRCRFMFWWRGLLRLMSLGFGFGREPIAVVPSC
jgi:hypothetical protein